jgi:crotonobetainyl-CoA:carnitine CoA-transferase CaiB-like acyl-CoA transferase
VTITNKRIDLELALTPFRVLDLCDEKGLLCGKMLADLGAEVIAVEPPSGNPARRIGPFYHDNPDVSRSLFWFAYSANKKSITLNLETRDGKEIFNNLVRKADFVVESFKPGYLDSLGVGYDNLCKINPRIILTSITPFGQSGPYAQYEASDIIPWAMSSYMHACGDADRAPLSFSFPQAYLHAAAEGAVASLIAYWYREATGLGQHVDVSAQESAIELTGAATQLWELNQTVRQRSAIGWQEPKYLDRLLYPCKDGYIVAVIRGGGAGEATTSSQALVAWMDEEGMAPQWLKDLDWVNDYQETNLDQKIVNRIEAAVSPFFLSKTKEELFTGAVQREILLAPVNDSQEVLADPQFSARGFWRSVEHDELKDSIIYPGPFVKMSRTPCRTPQRAPLIGEHNVDVYHGDLGLTKEQMVLLKGANVI